PYSLKAVSPLSSDPLPLSMSSGTKGGKARSITRDSVSIETFEHATRMKRSSAARSPAETAKKAPAASMKTRVQSSGATEGEGLGGSSKGKSNSKVSGRKGVRVPAKNKGLDPAGRKDSGCPSLNDNTIYDDNSCGGAYGGGGGGSAGHDVGNFSDGGGSATSEGDQDSEDSEPLTCSTVTTTKKAAYKSASWWSNDLLKDLWIFFLKIRKAHPVVLPQQGAAQVQKTVKEKKTKLAADKEARADEDRKVKDRLAQEQEDAKKQKACVDLFALCSSKGAL
ncbi:hypothetical protein B484DRAFT_471026, partial [Ochromonadaceae sp. CCMP2298]